MWTVADWVETYGNYETDQESERKKCQRMNANVAFFFHNYQLSKCTYNSGAVFISVSFTLSPHTVCRCAMDTKTNPQFSGGSFRFCKSIVFLHSSLELFLLFSAALNTFQPFVCHQFLSKIHYFRFIRFLFFSLFFRFKHLLINFTIRLN